MIHCAVGIAGLVLCLSMLLEGFEAIVLPQRVTRPMRATALFSRSTWRAWARIGRHLGSPRRREGWLRYFGPLLLPLLLIFWAVGLILGFAMIHWGLSSTFHTFRPESGFPTDLYLSGTTFFTMGFGDIVPVSGLARVLAVLEAGTGFGFLAVCIAYLPVFFQSFSRREVNISLLDTRAGSPCCALELIRRHAADPNDLRDYLRDWENWAAELLESHLSYPVLAYFRSQHDNQSWLAALTCVLDACALVIAGAGGAATAPRVQAQRTFATARHAVVDLAQVFAVPPFLPAVERLSAADLAVIRARLHRVGALDVDDADMERRVRALQGLYEPYVSALAAWFCLQLPSWLPADGARDNWQKSAWEQPVARRAALQPQDYEEVEQFW